MRGEERMWREVSEGRETRGETLWSTHTRADADSGRDVGRGRGVTVGPLRGGALPQPPDDPADHDCGREDREGHPAPLRARETVVLRGCGGSGGSCRVDALGCRDRHRRTHGLDCRRTGRRRLGLGDCLRLCLRLFWPAPRRFRSASRSPSPLALFPSRRPQVQSGPAAKPRSGRGCPPRSRSPRRCRRRTRGRRRPDSRAPPRWQGWNLRRPGSPDPSRAECAPPAAAPASPGTDESPRLELDLPKATDPASPGSSASFGSASG